MRSVSMRRVAFPPTWLAAALFGSAWRRLSLAEPWLITLPAFVAGAVNLALATRVRARERWQPLADVIFAAHTILTTAMHLIWLWHTGTAPLLMVKPGHDKDWLVHGVLPVLLNIGHQGYARDLLSLPVRLALAEFETLVRWYGIKHARNTLEMPSSVWASFWMQHLVGVVTPMLLFPPTSEPSQSSSLAAGDEPASPLVQRTSSHDSHSTQPDKSEASCHSIAARHLHHNGQHHDLLQHHHFTPCGRPHCHCRDVPYQSALGERVPFNIKVNTRHELEDLHPRALDNGARVVQGMDVTQDRPGPFLVLHAAVRRGCVLVALDCCMPPDAAITSNDALECAKHLLPSVMGQLGLSRTEGDRVLEPDQYVQLQLGSFTVKATMQQETGVWQFEVLPAEEATNGNMAPPDLQLRLAQPLPPADSITARNVNVPDMHVVAFRAQLQTSRQLWAEAVQVQGADPATHDPEHDKPGLQLWAQCQGQYLKTVVEHVSGSGLVHGAVLVPASVLAHHHRPHGPVACLQVLTLELWHGSLQQLSSTPLLLDTAQHLCPSISSQFGWWGASAKEAARVVTEVQVLTQLTTAQPSNHTAVTSHQAFVSDLATWCLAVQAIRPAISCDMCDPSVGWPPLPQLSPQHQTAMARSLAHYSREQQLPTVEKTTTRQQHFFISPSSAAPIHQALWYLRAAARLAALVPQCEQCDQLYYQKLRQQLRFVHLVVLSCTILASFIALQHLSYQVPAIMLYSIFLLCTLFLLSVVASTAWPTAGSHTPDSSPGRTCPAATPASASPRLRSIVSKVVHWLLVQGGVELCCFVFHLVAETAVWAGLIPMKTQECRVNPMVPYILTHTLFTVIGHTVWLWGRMPTWLLRSLTVVEAVLHTHCGRTCPSLPRWSQNFVVWGTVLLPWVLHLYWRRLVRPRRLTTTPQPRPSCC